MINSELKQVFTTLLGEGIEFIPKDNTVSSGEDVGKMMFIDFVEKWKSSWKEKQALFNRFGVDFDGYDSKIFYSLETLLNFSIGYVKAHIVMNFIYGDFDIVDTKFMITDKHGKDYLIKNTGELYDFIMNVKDDDFIIDEK